MKKVLLALTISILSITGLQAQLHESCGFDHAHQNAMSEDPDLAQTFQVNEQEIQRIISRNKNRRRSESVYTIPVVVHVIHTGEAIGVGSNISDAQINSGITQMNNAFRNTSGLSIDTKIQFQLAVKDPNCASTTGINRIDGSSLTDYATMGMERSTSNGATEAEIKALSRWSNNEYYNIWIITEIDNSNNGAGGGSYTAGFAYFPGASASVDGTVIVHPTFGNVGTAAGGTSGTLIHELGHALNLYHVFEGDNGGASCPPSGNQCGSGQGDCCSDTSPYKRTAFNCPTGTEACTGAAYDNTIKNYMDYSSAACQIMYTTEQKARMRAALEGTRGGLLLSNALNATAPALSVVAATCTPTSATPHSGSGIRNVQIEGKLNVSSGSSQTDGGYTNNTTSCAGAAVIDLSTQYEFNATVQTVNTHQVKAWIDYNNDGDFEDAGEEIYSNGSIDGTSAPKDSVNFTVPGTATTDKYLRMRVVTDFATIYGNAALSTACAGVTHGETEDYLVYINAGASPAPVADFTASATTICAGSSVTFNDASTNTPTSWSWTTTGGNPASSTNQNQAVVYNTPGTYTVSLVATNAGGSDTETKTNYITVEAPSVGGTISTDASVCTGSNGATLTLSGHTGSVVRWESSTDNFASTTTIANTTTTLAYSNLTNTTKYRAVVQSGACAAANSSVATITVNALPTVIVNSETICNGDAAATFTATSATAVSYVWSANGTGTAQTTTGTAAGNYTVQVTDGNGCVNSGTGALTVNALPVVSVNNASICDGDAAATFTAISDSTAASYLWSANGFGTASTTTGTTAGNYTVTITDNNSCVGSGSGVLTVNALPSLSVNSATVCSGDPATTFTATAPTATSYVWSGNGTGTASTTSGTASGNYIVQVSDANGCAQTDTGTLTVNTLPTVSVNDHTICNGDAAATFTATAPAATSYAWSGNGTGTTMTTSGTTAGNYTVTITDGNGCTASASGTLTVNALPVVSVNNASICDGDAAATFTAISDSTAASYLWSVNGSGTASTTTGTTVGDYTVTITDNNGCVGSGSGVLTVNALPSLSVNSATVCSGDPATTFTAAAPTATSYVWSGNGTGTASTTSGTASGNYIVQVTDGNGCTARDTGTLTVNTLPAIFIGNDTTFCGNGSTTLDAGAGFNTYAWSNGATTQTTTTSGAGDYSVTVTDLNGCQDHDTMTVNFSNPVVNLGNDTTFCGTASHTLDAGVFNTYAWSNGETTQTITVSATGNYGVTVTDANGCQDHDTVHVSISNPVVFIGNDTTFCGNGTTTLDAGSGFNTYAWSNGATTQTTITSGAGDYSVTVTDLNGCQDHDTMTVNFSNPVVDLGNDTSFCGSASHTLDAGAGFNSYSWSNGATTQSITTSTTGSYEVTVADAHGCQDHDTIVIGSHPTFQVFVNDTAICIGEPTATFAATSSSTITSYSWSGNGSGNGQTTTGTAAGNYTVIATNTHGCVDTATGTLTLNVLPIVNLGGSQTSCVATTLDAGNAGSTYVWSNGATTQTVSVSAGTHHVTVVDINGCVGSDTAQISSGSLAVDLGADKEICNGDFVTLDAGNPGSSYNWAIVGSPTTQTLTVSTSGEYQVYVTDPATGCQGEDTVMVTVNANPTVTSDPSFTKNYDITEGNIALTFGQPVGGTYSGVAVSANNFNTTSAGNGTHSIYYHYTDPVTGCSGIDTIDVTVSTATSVAGIAVNALQVSPNPFNGHLNVSVSSAASYQVLNGSGKLTLTGTLMDGASIINTESLAPGVYYLVISSDAGRSTVKVIKSR